MSFAAANYSVPNVNANYGGLFAVEDNANEDEDRPLMENRLLFNRIDNLADAANNQMCQFHPP